MKESSTVYFIGDTFGPPFVSSVMVYSITFQFAVYALFPVEPVGMVTFNCGIMMPSPVQPTNS